MGHALFLLAAGLTVLVAGGRLVVDAASVVGHRLGLSPGLVGLTIVAAGTSAPELAVVFQALSRNDEELAIGSIVGSNIANVLLVLGIAALIGGVRVSTRAFRIDIPTMVAASILTMLLAIDGAVGRLDGAILVGLLVLFVGGSIRRAGRVASGQEPTDGSPSPRGLGGLPRALTEFVVGLGLLVVSARWAVAGAEEIAIELGVSELVIGLTILAIGTSLPEIITTIVAAVRGSGDLALGNAVGSNIFNLLLVLGTAGLVSGGAQVSSDVASQAMPVMVVSALLLTVLVAGPRALSKRRGVVLVAAYTTYLAGLVWVSQ